MPSPTTQPRPSQTYTRDNDGKVFIVRRVLRPTRTVVLAAKDGSGAFYVSYSALERNFTAS